MDKTITVVIPRGQRPHKILHLCHCGCPPAMHYAVSLWYGEWTDAESLSLEEYAGAESNGRVFRFADGFANDKDVRIELNNLADGYYELANEEAAIERLRLRLKELADA